MAPHTLADSHTDKITLSTVLQSIHLNPRAICSLIKHSKSLSQCPLANASHKANHPVLFAIFTELSLSRNHESQSSKVSAAFRHLNLIRNLTFPLFTDEIFAIFIKHSPFSLCQGTGHISNDWHIVKFIRNYHLNPNTHLPQPNTHTQFSYISTYDTLHN